MPAPRVLVVEDDAPIRKGVADALRLAGYGVRECGRGDEAVRRRGPGGRPRRGQADGARGDPELIQEVSAEREAFLLAELESERQVAGDAMRRAIREQARAAGFDC